MLDPETGQQVRALHAKGALSPGVMRTTDCRGDHARLAAHGVTFIQPPAERPCGVEAVMRDDSGNWFSLTERKVGVSPTGHMSTCPLMQVMAWPPTQTVPSASWEMCTRPCRARAVPWRAM